MGLLVTPRVGALQHQHTLELKIGGAESNTAIAAARLGAAATWMGKIGNDGLGELVSATIRGQGVHVHTTVADVPTSLMVKERRSPTATRISYYRATGPGSRLTPDDLDEAAIREAGALHLTGITAALSVSARETVYAAVEIARAAAVPVSFDVNYRSALWSAADASPVLRDLAARADILFVGDDERDLLTSGGASDRLVAEQLSAAGPQEVVLKQGARGAAVYHADGFIEAPALPVGVVDVVGAGDAFAGGYLAEILAGKPVQQRLATAIACGAYATTTLGDWESAPTRQDLQTLGRETGVAR